MSLAVINLAATKTHEVPDPLQAHPIPK